MIIAFSKAWRLTRWAIHHNMLQHLATSVGRPPPVRHISPNDYPSPQQTASQKNSLPLLQFGDWEEGQKYDEDPPACIHYLMEWKVTLNNRTMAKIQNKIWFYSTVINTKYLIRYLTSSVS
jgi:hypothetical protein